MSYLTIHLISDLLYGLNEHSTEDEIIPDVDLCIINGNIGNSKRSMLYTETLCKKYPDTQFVYNYGENELHIEGNWDKYKDEYYKQIKFRRDVYKNFPTNLHWDIDPMTVECRGNKKVDILCLYGYPYIHQVKIPWEDTIWHHYYYKDIVFDDRPHNKNYEFIPKETSNVNHGYIHITADIEWVNQMHKLEWKKAQDFELSDTGNYKIYVTHFNPYKDTRFTDYECSSYNIHLDKTVYWLSGNTEMNGITYLGGKLYSNPGRGRDARNKVIFFN